MSAKKTGPVRILRTQSPTPLRVLGAEPAGVTDAMAHRVAEWVRKAYSSQGDVVNLTSVRFIPSTRMPLDKGAFQVMAKSTVEFVDTRKASPRAEAIESVVTVGRRGADPVLKDVKIPAFGVHVP